MHALRPWSERFLSTTVSFRHHAAVSIHILHFQQGVQRCALQGSTPGVSLLTHHMFRAGGPICSERSRRLLELVRVVFQLRKCFKLTTGAL